jgi:hypothetical protein
MSISPILLGVWAALAACFLALLVYRGQLTRYEDEQLFLNEDVNVFGGAAGLATASIVGIYAWKAWQLMQ